MVHDYMPPVTRPVPHPVRRSPLDSFAPAFARIGPRVRIIERPFRTMFDVQFPATVGDSLVDFHGLSLPGPLASTGGPDRSILWLGPGRYLAVTRSSTDTAQPFHDAGASSAVDVSAWRTIVDLCGPSAVRVLETGCSVDLRPTSFGPGACAQTLLARAPAIVQLLPDANVDPTLRPVYRILVRASYARHLALWLLDAIELIPERSPY